MRVSDGLWDRLEEKLEQVPVSKKKPKMIWWRFVAVIILIVSFNGVSWMTDIKNKVKESPEFEFQTENLSVTVKQQSGSINDNQTLVPIENNSEKNNQKLAVEKVNPTTPLRMTAQSKNINTNIVSEKEIPVRKEEISTPQPQEKLAQNGIQKPKERPKYITSSDLLFGVEIDKAKSETPKSAMGINTLKTKNDSDFPNPKRIKLFGFTLYDKDSTTTK